MKISGYSKLSKIKNLVTRYPLLVTFLLFTVHYSLLVVSCAPRHVELPSYEGIPIEKAISELKTIKSIEAVLSVEYTKNDSTMSGDALLNISENMLNLRLYYLGFLTGEVTEDNGVVKSKPKLDKNKSTILVEGLKNSFLWWNIKDYTLHEKEDIYELKNSHRRLLINKKTLLPIKQTIELNDGEELNIIYEEPAKTDVLSQQSSVSENNDEKTVQNFPLSLWYPSRLKIAFKDHSVQIKVKSYAVR